MNARETRRGLDEYSHIYRKPGGDWMDMAIFTENPAGIGRIWPFSHETRRGWKEYGHFHEKPAEDGMNMVIFTQNPTGMG